MTEKKHDLDALFASARKDPPAPPEALMARVLSDAHHQQAQGTVPVAQPVQGKWALFWQTLGGWPALGGLATATCAGIWLGVYPPQSVTTLTDGFLTTGAVSPLIDVSFEGAFDLTQEAL